MVRWFSPRKELIILWCLALFVWWVRYYPPGSDLMIFDKNARQHVYWTAHFQDPELFQNDLQTDFIMSSGFDPLGYKALYWLGTRFMDPLPFSLIVTLLLLLASLWLFYEIASEIIPNPRGRLICGVLLLLYSLYLCSGGLPRTFAYPLLLAYLFLLRRRGFLSATSTMPAAALFYPPVFINIFALAAWEVCFRLIHRAKSMSLVRDLLSFVVVALVTGMFLLSQHGITDGKAWGKLVTREAAREMPEFQDDGRTSFFLDNPFSYLLLGRSGIGARHIVGFAIVLALMAVFAGARRVSIPSISFVLVWTSLLLFGAAHLLLFRLHLPSRYTWYTIPLALILSIGASVEPVFRRFKRGPTPIPSKGTGLQASKGFGWAVVAVLVVAYAYVQGHYICRVDPTLVTLKRQDREMLAFLAEIPKDSLVAGHPKDMDNVPLVARRKVLANREMSLPYYLGYYSRIRTRIMDMLKAYYATSWEDVVAFIEDYGVYAVVVRKDHFRRDILTGSLYFEPFNSVIKKRLRTEDRLVLADPPQQLRCFENESYIVLCWES